MSYTPNYKAIIKRLDKSNTFAPVPEKILAVVNDNYPNGEAEIQFQSVPSIFSPGAHYPGKVLISLKMPEGGCGFIDIKYQKNPNPIGNDEYSESRPIWEQYIVSADIVYFKTNGVREFTYDRFGRPIDATYYLEHCATCSPEEIADFACKALFSGKHNDWITPQTAGPPRKPEEIDNKAQQSVLKANERIIREISFELKLHQFFLNLGLFLSQRDCELSEYGANSQDSPVYMQLCFQQKQWLENEINCGSFFVLIESGGRIGVFYNCWDIGGATKKNLVCEIQLSESHTDFEMQCAIDDLYKKCASYKDEAFFAE